MQILRTLPLQKAPGVAESLDWAQALIALHRDHLDVQALEQTLGCVLKVHEDRRVLDDHRSKIAPVLDGPARALEPGGHSLETDFGFGFQERIEAKRIVAIRARLIGVNDSCKSGVSSPSRDLTNATAVVTPKVNAPRPVSA